MFIVLYRDSSINRALFILSAYDVKFEAKTIDGDASTAYIVVDEERIAGDLRMAEIAFQMEFHQVCMKACPECQDKGEEVCGHLVFDTMIE
jgi:hypothetical protein